MSQGPLVPGSGTVRSLLFERLIDAGPGAGTARVGALSVTRAEVEASVAREIEALLNTRIDWSVNDIEPQDRTVLDYGLPDYSGMSAASDTDRHNIARAAERAIRAFEPRLTHARVSVVEKATSRASLHFTIGGTLVVNAISSDFAFALARNADGSDDGE